MKKILSYLLIFIYATIMIKPVMPSIADGFAHLLNYREHKATVHVENGKYHVHYEYIEAAKNNSKENAPYNNILKKADSSGEHLMFSTQPHFSLLADPQGYLNSTVRYLPAISLQEDFRPPIALVSVA
ncbi:MAG: hypothetical protein H7Z13_03485 [Ferruginibacter sp.]|nr:hypothetical protein [Ferruginibacter sp.]